MIRPDRLCIVDSYVFHQSKYSRSGNGSIVLNLACGHKKTQKTSIKIPKRARCRECSR